MKVSKFDSKGPQRPVRVVKGRLNIKQPDPLVEIAKEVARGRCTHPHLQFSRYGFQIACIDCERRWLAALDQGGVKFDVPDLTYGHPALAENEMRHSPNEPQRDKPINTKIR